MEVGGEEQAGGPLQQGAEPAVEKTRGGVIKREHAL